MSTKRVGMHQFSFVVGVACVLTGLFLTVTGNGQDSTKPPEKRANKESDPKAPEPKDSEAKKTEPKASETKAPKGGDIAKSEDAPTPVTITATDDPNAGTDADELSPDELALRKEAESFVNAYSENDAKSVASHFTTDAEYIGPDGHVIRGREAIEASLTAFFTEHPGCQLEVTINSLRLISPGVAIEDGVTRVEHSDQETPDEMPYTAVHIKSGERWQIASVRDHEKKHKSSHEEQLAKLNWLLGDWIDEDSESVVSFHCEPVDNGKFLLRQFSLKIHGREALSGSQRIGFDALTGQLKTWIFDSEGGHAEGTWHQHGDTWTLTAAGVTSDGEPASGTSVYKFVNDHTLTWQAVDHVVGGVYTPDSPVFNLVRKLPQPK